MLRTLYLDCYSGVSGDMLLGAFVELGVDVSQLRRLTEALDLDATIEAEKVRRAGFAATLVRVLAPTERRHRHLPEIERIISEARIPQKVKAASLAAFRSLAEAEAAAHGVPLERVHFHEVGAVDTIVDIVGAFYCLDLLGVDHVQSGRISVGSGTASMEHGTVSVPAPGTAHLLRGLPVQGGPVEGELCTPTGAAILRHAVNEWGPLPPMIVDRIGCGAGTKDFPRHPNILRAFLGVLEAELGKEVQYVWQLETSLDDVTGEVLGHVIDRLLEAGALDVTILPGIGKKNRPVHTVRVLGHDGNVRDLELLLFRETGTLGIRRSRTERRTLPRQNAVVETEFGTIAGKIAHLPDGTRVFTPEFEACRDAALRAGVPLRMVYEAATRAFASERQQTEGTP